MKKLILFALLFIAGCLLITSCNTSLTKRHYRKGFYVEHKKHPAAPAIANIAPKTQENAVIEHTITPEATGITSPETTKETNDQPVTGKKAMAPASKPKRFGSGRHLEAKDLLSVSKVKQSMKATAGKIIDPEAGLIGAALSLFWIVILVILAIYIVGLFVDGYGLGSFIHVLAIVVLVLLVLWLLRIL